MVNFIQTHHLKMNKEYWEAVRAGVLTFTVRRDDRGFQKDDIIILHKYDSTPGNGGFLSTDGRYVCGGNRKYAYRSKEMSDSDQLEMVITYILAGGQFGIEPGYVVMGLAPNMSEERRRELQLVNKDIDGPKNSKDIIQKNVTKSRHGKDKSDKEEKNTTVEHHTDEADVWIDDAFCR